MMRALAFVLGVLTRILWSSFGLLIVKAVRYPIATGSLAIITSLVALFIA